MKFKIPLSYLLESITTVTLSLKEKTELKHNPDNNSNIDGCYDYVFNDYLMSIILDESGIVRCVIADIDLYGSNHNVCIVKDGTSPVELKIFCCETDNDLDFTLFKEPNFFKIYRKFYEKLIENFLSSKDKSTLSIPQM